MNQKLVDSIVNAVLYEGCVLYPHRATPGKNRQGFTFGRVYPEFHSRAQLGAEPCSTQTECLVEGFPTAALEITIRFLQPMLRSIGAFSIPMRNMPAADNPDFFHVVPELAVDGRHYAGGQEAVERIVPMPAVTLEQLLTQSRTIPFRFPAARTLEPIRDHTGFITGVVVRELAAVSGTVELSAEPVGAAVTKIGVGIVNQTPAPRDFDDEDGLGMRTFASTHTILHVRDGAFFSMIDPPADYAQAATSCRNLGTWPVLIGDETQQKRDTLLSSPIILYDYPRITPEAPEEPFGPGEIDEALALHGATVEGLDLSASSAA